MTIIIENLTCFKQFLTISLLVCTDTGIVCYQILVILIIQYIQGKFDVRY